MKASHLESQKFDRNGSFTRSRAPHLPVRALFQSQGIRNDSELLRKNHSCKWALLLIQDQPLVGRLL
jgi:hypothetical protein